MIDSEEYAAILDRIVKLHKLQAEEKPKRVSPDTLVLAGTNLLGIIVILKYRATEHHYYEGHEFRSEAQVIRPKRKSKGRSC